MFEIVIIVFTISSVIQVYFWIFRWGRLKRKRRSTQQGSPVLYPNVTVIIAAKDELSNIKRHLATWLDQDYPNYQLIIVNDHSADQTWALISSIDDHRVTSLNLPDTLTGKKAALTYAIERSTSEWIVTTDADCRAQSDAWLSTLLASSESSDVILGYSPYASEDTPLSTWISFEAWYIGTQYLSAATAGWAYMGVGRNLAFRRSVFHAVNGYNTHIDIKSGDDDLLINSLGSAYKYDIALDPKSWVDTYPQKSRHLTTSPRYRTSVQLILITIYGSQLIWYLSVFILLYSHPVIGLSCLAIRYVMTFLVYYKSPLRTKQLKWAWVYPFFDLGLCCFYLVMSLTYLRKNDDW